MPKTKKSPKKYTFRMLALKTGLNPVTLESTCYYSKNEVKTLTDELIAKGFSSVIFYQLDC